MFSHPNQERRSDSKCFSLWERARKGKVVPDPEEVRTNCEWTTSDGGESFSSSLDTDGAVDDLRPVVAAMNSFIDGTDGEPVIESLAVSDGVITEGMGTRGFWCNGRTESAS